VVTMNANALFVGANSSTSYHQGLLLPDHVKKTLLDADRELRKAIRQKSEDISKFGQQMELATQNYRASNQNPLTFEVRFLLQGGLAYGTAVLPAQSPPQQSDRDTGVYVRTSFMSRQEPGLASQKLFGLVESAIESLCNLRNWKAIRKDTCIRIELNEFLHIDLPLYAIPDEEFETLQKGIRDASGHEMSLNSTQMLSLMDAYRTLRLPEDRIMLAHDEKGWVQSDPRALHDWFDEQFKRYGSQVRRQSRYFKGWRDFNFEKKGPSSVFLMVCVANCYRDGMVFADENRDDLAFLQIAQCLPEMMMQEVTNPVLSVPSALNAWGEIERKQYERAANNLNDTVTAALSGHYVPSITIDRLQKALGSRIPNRPDLVKAHTTVPEVSQRIKAASTAPLAMTVRTTSG